VIYIAKRQHGTEAALQANKVRPCPLPEENDHIRQSQRSFHATNTYIRSKSTGKKSFLAEKAAHDEKSTFISGTEKRISIKHYEKNLWIKCCCRSEGNGPNPFATEMSRDGNSLRSRATGELITKEWHGIEPSGRGRFPFNDRQSPEKARALAKSQ
jgi:hypothetical protein